MLMASQRKECVAQPSLLPDRAWVCKPVSQFMCVHDWYAFCPKFSKPSQALVACIYSFLCLLLEDARLARISPPDVLHQPYVCLQEVRCAHDIFRYVAKRYNQSSVLGSYLDPLADKVLIGCIVGALGYQVLPTPPAQVSSLSLSAVMMPKLLQDLIGVCTTANYCKNVVCQCKPSCTLDRSLLTAACTASSNQSVMAVVSACSMLCILISTKCLSRQDQHTFLADPWAA